MADDFWWGYSRRNGWVVLDRTKACNKPGKVCRLLFIRCRDWTEFEEERENWDPPEYLYAPNYIKQLDEDAAIQARFFYQELVREWPTRKRQLEKKIRERKRLEYKAAESSRQKKIEARPPATEKQKSAITARFSEYRISCLWHITHKDNVSSILKFGILNHYDAHRFSINRVDISDPDAQRLREHIEQNYNRRIHDYAPLYLIPRNPMLYVLKHQQDDLCLIEVSLTVLADNEYLITDGNAASWDTRFYSSVGSIELLPWDVLHASYWADLPDGKRKRCAEVLVYPKIAPEYIKKIHCYSINTLNYLSDCGREVSLTREMFF